MAKFVRFTSADGDSVAINPEYVMRVETVSVDPPRTAIIMLKVEGNTTDDYLVIEQPFNEVVQTLSE